MFFLEIWQGTLEVKVFRTSLYEDLANDYFVHMARHIIVKVFKTSQCY
jgi:thiaminase